MFYGYLVVEVRISERAIPIQGATVYLKRHNVSQDSSFEEEIMDLSDVSDSNYDEVFITNESGETNIFTIESPDPALANDVNNTEIPYSTCDIFVMSQGFVSTRIRGVQIFGGKRSTLPVNLLAQPAAQEVFPQSITFIIPPNTLLLGVEKNHQWEGASCVIPLIATDVYIPETISVHLGPPASSANNVYVSFVQYVKNVASSEVYPTWPDSSLRSNIFAMISLALNRVFTEWYFCQGFDFQITNSTQYDQSYVHGRNIFANISELVDEIFNTYIRRIGNIEPLFASYCDGKRTMCVGMHQWGTVTLAEQNMIPIQILRSYYGEDIELVTTDFLQPVQASYPGTPLSYGSQGDDVASIQRQLNRIRANYPAIPVIAVENGIFGLDTDAAVRKYQQIFNLTIDGVVGPATWYSLSYVYTSVTRLAELTSEGVSPRFPVNPPDVVLTIGSRGNEVTLMQYLIDYIAMFYQTVPQIAIDGFFGPQTKEGVVAFQNTFGLPPTGEVDAETWNTLYVIYESLLQVVLPILAEQQFPSEDLTLGSSGDIISLVQSYLNEIANAYPQINRINVTGIFDEDTQNTVMQFQTFIGAEPTGIIDFRTWIRIVELYNFLISEALREPPIVDAFAEQSEKRNQNFGFVAPETDSYLPERQWDILREQPIEEQPVREEVIEEPIREPIMEQPIREQLDIRQQETDKTDTPIEVTPPVEIEEEMPLNNTNSGENENSFDDRLGYSYPEKPIRYGFQGDIVCRIQEMLNDVNQRKYNERPIHVSCYYGNSTRIAISIYQKNAGLEQTGIVDEATWNSLVKDFGQGSLS